MLTGHSEHLLVIDLQSIRPSNKLAARKYGVSWYPVLPAKLLAAIV